ncbi:MAG: nucleotidyltransferase family protein [Chloroflexota bacterium]|nr:nucleotidyltransferase family protein [Chloroflexota bacterium]
MIPTREYVLEELFKVRATLRSFGVRRIAVFGSVARNTARADSDIDIVVDIPRGQITIENFFGLQDFLNDHFQRKVDVITESSVKPFARDLVMRDAVFLEGLQSLNRKKKERFRKRRDVANKGLNSFR